MTIHAAAATFGEELPQGGRLIGIDLGTKTIGLALCDTAWHIATPAHLIKRTKFKADKALLAEFVRAQKVMGLVLGLPLNLDGSDSPRTQATRAFARNIEDLGVPILLWDERWSTRAVERAMISADLSRAKRAVRVDSAAAAYILQGALDALSRTPLNIANADTDTA